MDKPKKIVVTGGSGFIGSNLIKRIMTSHPDWFVINFDKLTYAGNPANLTSVEKNPHYIFVQADVADKVAIESLLALEGPDVVIHMAAESHVDRSINNADEFIQTNIVGTYNVLEGCRKGGIKKVIYVSTDEVYGSQDQGEFVDEKQILNPSSVYSASKAAGDLLAISYFKTYGTPVLVTRSSNNFGQNQYPEKLIPLIITNLSEGKKIPVYGEGDNVRDWLFVEDNCAAIEMLIEKGEPGEIYNITAKNEYTNLEIVHKILKAMGKTEDEIEYVADRPGHDFRYAMRADKIKDLGWAPKCTYHNFNTYIMKTVKWYLGHEDWWKSIKSGEYLNYYENQYKGLGSKELSQKELSLGSEDVKVEQETSSKVEESNNKEDDLSIPMFKFNKKNEKDIEKDEEEKVEDTVDELKDDSNDDVEEDEEEDNEEAEESDDEESSEDEESEKEEEVKF